MTTQSVKFLLNPLFDRYNRTEFLASDPLEFVHRFQDPWDQEIVGLWGALLAYGNVKTIRNSVQDLLARIEGLAMTPAELIRGLDQELVGDAFKKSLSGYKHRLYVGSDLFVLSWLVHLSWKKYGSLGAHLANYRRENDPDFSNALNQCLDEWKIWLKEQKMKTGKGFLHLIPAPRAGSTCKRWCMYLRWMIRKDRLDVGIWAEGSLLLQGKKAFRPDQLVMPLDTHTGRISQYLGLTSRKSLNWRAALEVTESLRECEPSDPVKYDFALARLGILDLCKRSYRAEICEKCELRPACKFANRSQKAKLAPLKRKAA